MDVLVVAAHPDDEVLGCGGTIARLSTEGHRVHLGILGEGATSRYPRPQDAPRAEVQRLADQARAAAKVLGAHDVALAGLPDNRMDTVPLLDVVKTVEAWIARTRPAAVYTHHPGDLNVDHGIAFRATLTATRPLAGCPVRELLSFEVPSASEWSFQRVGPPFAPTVFVDIADHLGTKAQAFAAYEGETRPFPHPRSPEAIRALAARWGSAAGLRAAEAFELVRAVR